MKADAFRYASEGQYSQEINTLRLIERFGLEAVTGRRELYYGELQRMIYAENIVTAYQARKASKVWGEWAKDNPRLDKMLQEAELLCQS